MPSPTFTVVMPAYNAARTIESAIRSVMAQTVADFELIVVDDGSTDDTADRVRPFEADQRVHVVRQANGGLSAARNAALSRSRGRYVSLLDSDDLWLPTYLERMQAALDASPDAAMAYADAWILDDRTRRIRRAKAMAEFSPPAVLPRAPREVLRMLLVQNFIFVAVTLRRSVLEVVGPFRTDLRATEDHELWLRLLANGHPIVYVPATLSLYRRREGQLSGDELLMTRMHREMYRLVAATYDLDDDSRALASAMAAKEDRRLATLEGRSRPGAAVVGARRMLGRVKRRVLDRRLWRATPPPEVAKAFPDLHAV